MKIQHDIYDLFETKPYFYGLVWQIDENDEDCIEFLNEFEE